MGKKKNKITTKKNIKQPIVKQKVVCPLCKTNMMFVSYIHVIKGFKEKKEKAIICDKCYIKHDIYKNDPANYKNFNEMMLHIKLKENGKQ